MKKIKFEREKKRYVVQAHDDRFFICTKPLSIHKTYLYTICDLERKMRGPVNLIFGLSDPVDSPESAAVVLKQLQDGEVAVSERKDVDLLPSEIEQLEHLIKAPL
jgi:hypothetical protein